MHGHLQLRNWSFSMHAIYILCWNRPSLNKSRTSRRISNSNPYPSDLLTMFQSFHVIYYRLPRSRLLVSNFPLCRTVWLPLAEITEITTSHLEVRFFMVLTTWKQDTKLHTLIFKRWCSHTGVPSNGGRHLGVFWLTADKWDFTNNLSNHVLYYWNCNKKKIDIKKGFAMTTAKLIKAARNVWPVVQKVTTDSAC